MFWGMIITLLTLIDNTFPKNPKMPKIGVATPSRKNSENTISAMFPSDAT